MPEKPTYQELENRVKELEQVLSRKDDVRETHENKAALKESKERLELAARAADLGIWDWDIQKNQLVWNDRMYALYGIKKTDFPNVYEAWLNGLHPDDRAENDRISELARRGEREYDTEFRVVAPDGTVRFIKALGQVIWDPEGTPIRMTGINYDITELRQALDELRYERNFAENLIRTAQIIILVLDPDGGIVRFNPYMEELTGYRLEEVVGKDWFSTFISPGNGHRIKKLFRQAIHDIQTRGNINTIISKSGHPIQIEWYDKTLKDSDGHTMGLIAVGQDVTERLRYESEQEIMLALLRAMHSQDDMHSFIRSIIELMQHWSGCEAVGIRLKDGDDYPYFETKGFPQEFVDAERRLCRKNKKGDLIVDTAGNPMLECMCGNVICGRYNPEMPFFSQNGSFWTNSTTELLASTTEKERLAKTRNRCRGEGYESVALIPLVFGDQRLGLLQFNDSQRDRFDEKKIRLFERLASSLAMGLSQRITSLALEESETKYRTMMEAMDDAAYICSKDFRLEYMNSAMVKRIGYDATGEFCHKVIHGLDEKCPWCNHERVMKGESIKSEVVNPTDNRIYHASNSPVIHSNGTISKLTLFRDITDTKKIEERLMQAQKMEAIGSLAGGIAHDFNNILFPIVGMAEMLLEDLPYGSTQYKNTREILAAGKRGSGLVKQILAFSRQNEPRKMPIQIQRILKEVLTLCRSTIPADVKITRDISDSCGFVMADATQLHQIAMNLITNAYHAVADRDGTINIRLQETAMMGDEWKDSQLQPGSYAMLSVEDNGCGIPPEAINKIFEPYFTTKTQDKGTGLGLAVVYGIVKEHHGDIHVYSDVGKGTTFNVYIPLMQKKEQTTHDDKIDIIQMGSERILLVDDDAQIARLEKQMLERLGYQVTALTNSIEALDRFLASPHSFDAVITDMTMPNMPGNQLARELIAIRSDIPIIICTGFSERINEEKAESLGVKGLLMKPVVKSDMARMVRSVLDEDKGFEGA